MPARMTEPEAVQRYIDDTLTPHSPIELLERYVVSSVVPGICMVRDCAAITGRCEPDATDNWCHECHGQTVHSLSDLLLAVEL
jgi:hypothetical protein